MKKMISIAACAAIFAIAGNASAYSFDMGTNSTVTGPAFTDPGLVMHAYVYDINSVGFSLNPGESYSFKFAKFWTNESWVNSDDLAPQALTASVDFDMPDLFQDVNGTSVGFSGFLAFTQGWKIEWSSPVSVAFGSGGLFDLSLSNASFSQGWWHGPDSSQRYGTDVYATVTHRSDPVPEPGTMLLMGAGLAGLAGYSRKRSRKS